MRRLISIVIAIHCLLLTFISVWKPSTPPVKKRIEVRTVAERPFSEGIKTQIASKAEGSSSIKTQEVKLEGRIKEGAQLTKQNLKKNDLLPKTAAPRLSPAAPSVAMKKINVQKEEPLIPLHLLKELEETVAKIDGKGDKIKTKEASLVKNLSSPHFSIAISDPIFVSMQKEEDDLASGVALDGKERFVSQLVTCLAHALCLPEKGSVKLKVTLSREGRCLKVDVIESQSRRNEKFLLEALFSVVFPPFTAELGKEKEHAFVIAFCER